MRQNQNSTTPTKSRTTLAVSVDAQLNGISPAFLEEILRRHLAKILSGGALYSEVLSAKPPQGDIVVFNLNSSVTSQVWPVGAQPGQHQTSAPGVQGFYPNVSPEEPPPFTVDQEKLPLDED